MLDRKPQARPNEIRPRYGPFQAPREFLPHLVSPNKLDEEVLARQNQRSWPPQLTAGNFKEGLGRNYELHVWQGLGRRWRRGWWQCGWRGR